MKRKLLLGMFMSMILNLSYSQCGITGMQSQILQGSSFPIQNESAIPASVKIIDGNYPTTIGVQDSSTPGIGEFRGFGPNEQGNIVSSSTSTLGIYEIELASLSGCIDTVEVEVVLTLPVEWLKPLSVSERDKNIKISFATASETNNSHFEIQHSNSGRDFQTIGSIEGHGNTTSENHYEYLHKKPNEGTNYYRVKQVDFDGQYDYSNIAVVNHKPQAVAFYPNPTTDKINLQFNKPSQVTIYTGLGVVLDRFELEAGTQELALKKYGQSLLLLQVGEEWIRVVVE